MKIMAQHDITTWFFVERAKVITCCIILAEQPIRTDTGEYRIMYRYQHYARTSVHTIAVLDGEVR